MHNVMLVCENEKVFEEAASVVSKLGANPVRPWSDPADIIAIVDCGLELYEKAKTYGEERDVPVVFARSARHLRFLVEQFLRPATPVNVNRPNYMPAF
ncbi:hypothetical protein EDD75_0343 [Thermodesulfitimonas autotrophica]|uniref:Uncharacterized protein n=1 Tax=Thermodesulfitimonas autotrophica TaxID=1894989 RepID=A0A3N5AX72_9THEO|nr:hypothetical protein [Thermodesulfitimonas autotrophica]RPF49527.1 hypothetical protein EDD75_0343 [Thermodesulfitimonas autotrophica]